MSTQVAMRCRVTPTARQLRAAELMIVEGRSALDALTAVGYARSTARNPSQLIRNCKGLRAAIRIVQERTCCYLTRPAPARRRRYDRRPTVAMVEKYVTPDAAEQTSNAGPNGWYEQERRARAIDEGRPAPAPIRSGPKPLVACPACHSLVKPPLVLSASQDYLVCEDCRYSC